MLFRSVPVLSAHGIALIQPTRFRDGITVVETYLIHGESGEYLGCEYPVVPSKADPQGLGSALTYARRYSLCSLLGIAADDDDDGNAASQPPRQEQRRSEARPAATAPPRDEFRDWLDSISGKLGISAPQMVHHLAKEFASADCPGDLKSRGSALRSVWNSPARGDLKAAAVSYQPALARPTSPAEADPDMP